MRPRALPVLALALMACGDAAAGPGVSVTDSAGVEVVAILPEAVQGAPRWTLSPEPTVELRSREADGLILFEVRDARALPSGRVAVANGGGLEGLVLGRDGALVARLGRGGDGPGEFRNPSTVFPLGDSVGVYDAARRRLSVFAPDGALAREVAFAWEGQAGAFTAAHPGQGSLVLAEAGGLPTEMGVSRAPARFLRFGADGTLQTTYPELPGNELYRGPQLMGLLLFGALTVSTTAGEYLVVGLGDEPELRYYAPGGTLARLVRWPDADRTVTPERVQAFLEVGLAAMPEAQRPAARQMFEQLPHAERMPAYQDLLGTAAGDVWVGPYLGPEQSQPGYRLPAREWRIFGASGALVAVLETPEGFRPQSVEGDEVLGVFTDELGVEAVRGHRIVRGGS